MPRVQADDYDVKARNIKDEAAKLFAETGYTGTKLADVAKACGASKSMLYHYFPTKDHLLYAMLEEHLLQIIAALEEAEAMTGAPADRFGKFLQNFLQKSTQTRQRNMIAMNDMKHLPKPMQTSLIKLEKRVVDLIVDQLRSLNANLAPDDYKPYALLLIGMLNWTDTWYNPRGPLKPTELVGRISQLFLSGFGSVTK